MLNVRFQMSAELSDIRRGRDLLIGPMEASVERLVVTKFENLLHRRRDAQALTSGPSFDEEYQAVPQFET